MITLWRISCQLMSVKDAMIPYAPVTVYKVKNDTATYGET